MRIVKPLLVSIVGIVTWGILAAYLALEGVWITSIVAKGNTDAFYDWAVSELSSKNQGNSALVLLQNGKVAKQYFAGAQESVDEVTIGRLLSHTAGLTDELGFGDYLFEDYIQSKIFDPLGMKRSTYTSINKMDNVSSSYNSDGTEAQS